MIKLTFLKYFLFVLIIFNTVFLVNANENTTFLTQACNSNNDFDSEFSDYCSAINTCKEYNPSNSTNNTFNLITIKTIPFEPILKKTWWLSNSETENKTNSDEYKNFLNSSFKTTSFWNLWTNALEQSKFIYTETQNAIFNCAIIQTKIKVWKSIMEYLKNKNLSSNISKKIDSLNKSLQKELEKKNCNWAPNWSQANLKNALLYNTTYHYCNYRAYLDYLTNFPIYNITWPKISSKTKTPKQDKIDSAELSKNVVKQWNLVQKEIMNTKHIFEQSLYAFNEFENSYWIHIMLMFIFDDYVQIRDNLTKLLNPISQLVYKIPQCQSNGK